MGEIIWEIIVPPGMKPEWDAASDAERAAAEAWATEVLRALTGGVFGVEEISVRPVDNGPARGNTYDGTLAVRYPYGGYVSSRLHDPVGAAFGPVQEIALIGPIHSIESVMVDGQVLPSSAYRVRNRRWLRRVDGSGWPTRQDLNAADNAVGAFTVVYRRGIEPSDAGKLAAGRLAVEALRDMAGQSCALPRGITTITREGVSISVDPRAFFEEGMTGVDAVDQWILAVGKSQRAQIVNPQHRAAVRFS
ncbi:head-to-tail adaptor [Gordonia phage Lilbeanie]|uniref:Head-to-tail adaptor n=1 Tax=Gordonia phage Lilbeanie TaxID=2794947 RepID=A0A7T1NWH3_9CAUD|nr:head-tail adaptor [Gordonia phage Lilbeanie]QPO17100.1 head-to-tail adaptor [Gordonia phage Lilbeanie]